MLLCYGAAMSSATPGTGRFPNHTGKDRLSSHVSAQRWAAYHRSRNPDLGTLPPAAIMCFQRHLHGWLSATYQVAPSGVPGCELLTAGERQLALLSGRIGAPAAVLSLEHAVAFGVETVLFVGYAGGLQPAAAVGDVVVCDAAIRDEGTSYHYAPAERAAVPSGALTQTLSGALAAAGLDHDTGATWTTDAPYRETAAEVEAYRAAGVLSVEMEASALFVVADALGIDIAAAFVISDTLGVEWDPQFHADVPRLRLREVAKVAVGLAAELLPSA